MEQGADQTGAVLGSGAVGEAAELGEQVDHPAGPRPAQHVEAAGFGAGVVGDEQLVIAATEGSSSARPPTIAGWSPVSPHLATMQMTTGLSPGRDLPEVDTPDPPEPSREIARMLLSTQMFQDR